MYFISILFVIQYGKDIMFISNHAHRPYTFIKTKWRKIKFMIKNDQIDQKKSDQCLENCFWFKFTYPTDVKKQVLLVSCSFTTIPVGGWLAGRSAG